MVVAFVPPQFMYYAEIEGTLFLHVSSVHVYFGMRYVV